MTHICRNIIIAGHTGATEEVLEALSHPNSEARKAALGAARRLEILKPAALLSFFDDADIALRYRAVEIAATMPVDRGIAKKLIEALANPELAEVAAFALGELELVGPIRSEATEALSHQARSHEDPLCRESAVAALGALGEGLEVILEATTDIATVRRRAVLALAPFDGPEVDQTLERALSDRDWQVRQAAEDLLAP